MVKAAIDEEQDSRIFLRSYKADSDDVLWAQRGVVATVANGEAGSVVRRRVQDAGFKELDLLHLGAIEFWCEARRGRMFCWCLTRQKTFFVYVSHIGCDGRRR
jgi:hypothetical protein